MRLLPETLYVSEEEGGLSIRGMIVVKRESVKLVGLVEFPLALGIDKLGAQRKVEELKKENGEES